MRSMPILSFSFLFLLNSLTIHTQEAEDYTKKIEKIWGWEEETKSINKKEINIENPVPVFLSQFQPQKQEFPINPTMENIIKGKAGTKITIPAHSIALPSEFRKGDILTIQLIEIYNDLDFITSGISLFYFNPEPNIFESGGMFKLTATYYDKPLQLKRGARLKVEIPSHIKTDKKMNMYRLDERNGWIDKGSVSVEKSSEKIENPASEGPDKKKDGSSESGVEYIPSYIFRAMDEFKWWNADYPNPNTTCIEGTIQTFEANPPYSITSLGIDFKNATTRYADGKKFQLNVIKAKNVKLIAVDERGNIGLISEINTGNLNAFIKEGSKEKCTNVGTIEIKKVDREILKDRGKLLNHLGLKDIVK